MQQLVFAIAMLGLTVASIAVWWLFEFFLPMLLSILSIFFGRPLRRTAHRLSEIGREGRRGLRRARRALSQSEADNERVRVRERGAPPGRRVRVEFDSDDVDEESALDAEENHGPGRETPRRSREPPP